MSCHLHILPIPRFANNAKNPCLANNQYLLSRFITVDTLWRSITRSLTLITHFKRFSNWKSIRKNFSKKFRKIL